MDRNEFLLLCKQAGMTYQENKDIMVEHKGIKYYPYAYQLRFDGKGNVLHTAILTNDGMLMYARLEDVKKVGGAEK